LKRSGKNAPAGRRRNGAGRPFQGGTGGPPPESLRWSSATAGQGHEPGGTRGFPRSVADARSRARGGRFRAAPHDKASGARFVRVQCGGFRPPAGVFSDPRAADCHTQRRRAGRGRQAGGRRATAAKDARRYRPGPRVSSGRGRKAARQSPPGAKAPDISSVTSARSRHVNPLG
jgi:hypothetical protein